MPADQYSCILSRKNRGYCLCILKTKFKKAAKAIYIFLILACNSLLSDGVYHSCYLVLIPLYLIYCLVASLILGKESGLELQA